MSGPVLCLIRLDVRRTADQVGQQDTSPNLGQFFDEVRRERLSRLVGQVLVMDRAPVGDRELTEADHRVEDLLRRADRSPSGRAWPPLIRERVVGIVYDEGERVLVGHVVFSSNDGGSRYICSSKAISSCRMIGSTSLNFSMSVSPMRNLIAFRVIVSRYVCGAPISGIRQSHRSE